MTLKESSACEFLERARGKVLAVDTETNAKDIRDGRGYAVGVSICFEDPTAEYGYSFRYFPFRHLDTENNFGPRILSLLREVIETAPALIFHNAKFDIVSLSTLGIRVRSGTWFCTMIACHLINENYPYSKSLDSCCKAYLGEEWHKEMPEEMAKIIKTKGLGWEYVPAWMMESYAAWDAHITFRLRNKILPLFLSENLEEYWPYKARLIEVVIEMESRGVGVDVAKCEAMIDAADQAIQDYGDMLGGINASSSSQLVDLLINKMGLPVVKRTPGGKPSTDREAIGIYEEILENLGSPIAEYILGYRGWVKAKSAFYGAYLEHLSPDGRLRPSYRHHKDSEEGGTVTGRLSCANPNLQQIPRKSDKPWNGAVKSAFKPSEGYLLWEADYSQLELRLGTAYAKEPTLKRVFIEGRDIFTEMSGWLGWPRHNVKTFVYSTQYGAGKTRISHVFQVSPDKAQELINQYYDMFPGFRAVTQNASAKAMANRKIRLWSGRYRHFAKPRDEAHKAFNSLIQGGAADVVERIMIALFDEVDQKSNGEVRMLLQVHDSVIFEIKQGREQYWESRILEVMQNVNQICADFDVKFAVDFHRFGGD